MRLKFWWMIPRGMRPSIGDYFRIGKYVGKCVFKCPLFVVQYIPKGFGVPTK